MTMTFAQAGIPTWHPHWDVWALVFILGGGYWFAVTRIGPLVVGRGNAVTRRQALAFASGVAILWAVSDWPLHDLAEQRLFIFHMIEHMALGLIVPPLLIVGTPAWLARKVLANRFTLPILRPMVTPITAFLFFNLLLVAIHWPAVINTMVRVPIVHFALHAVIMTAAVIMWLPVLSVIPELPRMKPATRMLYLFAHSLLPTIPASFLTFGTTPLYEVYADAPRMWGIDVITDQTVAGLIMKLGGGAILWGVITVLWFRWYADEQRWETLERELRHSP
jgi:putative membrane protein